MRKGYTVQPRVLLSYYEYQAYQRPDVGTKRTCGVRKKMVPLIKLVHPDLFAQYPPKVASTNSKSLKVIALVVDSGMSMSAFFSLFLGTIPTPFFLSITVGICFVLYHFLKLSAYFYI